MKINEIKINKKNVCFPSFTRLGVSFSLLNILTIIYKGISWTPLCNNNIQIVAIKELYAFFFIEIALPCEFTFKSLCSHILERKFVQSIPKSLITFESSRTPADFYPWTLRSDIGDASENVTKNWLQCRVSIASVNHKIGYWLW